MDLSIVIFQLIAGISVLILGAQCFVKGASGIARYYHLPPLFIGIVLVGLGTSCPELVVSLVAAVKGSGAIAIGNAIGSNIANIGLVLGLTALILPLQVRSRAIQFEIPIYLGAAILLAIAFYFGHLTRVMGIAMLVALLLYLYVSFLYAKRHAKQKAASMKVRKPLKNSIKYYFFLWLIGLALVIVSAEWLVDGAQAVARAFGVSELVIGLTVVAIGTTLPELAATVVSAFHHEHDIAVGNIVGSNIFNLLGVLAMPAIFAPGAVTHIMFIRDYVSMLVFSFVLAIIILIPPHLKVNRIQAVLLLLMFIAYMVILYMTSGGVGINLGIGPVLLK